MAKERAHVYVSGRVQGVYFRHSTRREAMGKAVAGWVRNLSDGRVEAVFEGEAEDVHSLIRWCQQGPPHAVVDEVEVVREDYTGQCEAFVVR